MPRGKGRQTGEEQQAHPQATDLSKSPPIVPGGEDRAALEEVVQTTPSAASAQSVESGGARMATPDDVPGMLDASVRPGEPIQSGLRGGPGVGPLVDGSTDIVDQIAALYRKFPSPALHEMLQSSRRRAGR